METRIHIRVLLVNHVTKTNNKEEGNNKRTSWRHVVKVSLGKQVSWSETMAHLGSGHIQFESQLSLCYFSQYRQTRSAPPSYIHIKSTIHISA